MAEPTPQAKSRVLTHMNKDHRHDLSAILQHQLSISCPTPEMTDITLSTLTIRANSKSHTIPITPPMTTFSDCRPRLVSMTLAARSALGLVRVTRFLAPTGGAALVLAAVTFYFFCFGAVRAGFMEKGSVVWRVLEGVFPGGGEGFRWTVDAIFVPVLVIHLVECWWLDRTRLRGKMDRMSGVWWAWMGCCFLEGLTAFKRFDREVERLVGKKE